jgi:hypothetical protein
MIKMLTFLENIKYKENLEKHELNGPFFAIFSTAAL